MKQLKKILLDGFHKRSINVNFEDPERLDWNVKERWFLSSYWIIDEFILDFNVDKSWEIGTKNVYDISIYRINIPDNSIAEIQLIKGLFDIKISNFWMQFDINSEYSNIVDTNWINSLSEFNNAINSFWEITFFVHSNWSSNSRIGLLKYADFCKDYTDIKKIIDNSSADSFIYDWLKKYEKSIYGNGEVFKIKNRKLHWFKESINSIEE